MFSSERPMPWDRKSTLTTLGFFGGVVLFAVVVAVLLSKIGPSKGAARAGMLHDDPIERARQIGCQCTPAARTPIGPGERPYYCVCPKSKPSGGTQSKHSSKGHNSSRPTGSPEYTERPT
ncbi:uncharacterized protein [Dermacentor albipictus]|uniref:uncharacterized protein isoform X4 n=1 Tax=Dermacentor albipictus TaxID=60249 RepID=UPI0031FD9F3C